MRHGEIFAGISGFGLGFERAGMETAWAVEIDPACQRVLRHHHPGIPILGDVRECGAHNLEPVDIISFGSPCQDISVAGKRKGLHGERSGLFFEAIRIIRELGPTWAVWENVPGALSSNSGRDFGAALDALAQCGAVDICWRVLDAQYFGVAQRRARVFVVASFRAGHSAAEVLFEPEGRIGDTPPRREAGQRVAGSVEDGAGKPFAFNPQSGGDVRLGAGPIPIALQANQVTGVAVPLTAHPHRDGDGDTNYVTYAIQDAMREKDQNGLGVSAGSMFTLDGASTHAVAFTNRGVDSADVGETLRSGSHDASEDGTGRGVPLVFESRYARNGRGAPDTIVPPLKAQSGQTGKGDAAPLVFDTTQVTSKGNYSNPKPGDPCHPLAAGAHAPSVAAGMAVRRLTPTECERLQSFPDGWTDVDGMSDSARYRMLGNAVCVNVAEWIGERIVRAAKEEEEYA